MNNLADIKRRIATVKQTRQITSAMETISVAKMRKSAELCERSRAYLDRIKSIASLVADKPTAKNGGEMLIVVSSDKGLCGGFNHDIINAAARAVKAGTVVVPVGRSAYDKLKTVAETYDEFVSCDGAFDYGLSKRIAQKALSLYGTEISSVSIAYGRFDGHAGYAAVVKRLLPIEADGESTDEIELQPTPAEVGERLLPLYLAAVIYDAFIDSAASEHVARRTAMSASTKNADEIISSLSVEYNRARQGAVTEQITEIIGSTRALNGLGGR